MTSPSLPPAVAALGQQIAQLGARIAQLERNQRASQLANTSIEGGTLAVNDVTGATQLVVGLQSDGMYTVQSVSANAPAVAPSVPSAGAAPFGVWVSWNGIMADGTLPLSDFAYVQVHCSPAAGFTPSPATLQGQMPGAGLFGVGQLEASLTYYVALVAVNESGNAGPASGQASAVPFAPGGPNVTIAATAPGSPDAGDLWYNTSAGNVLSQWSGSAWVAYQYGTGAIATGAITAAQIAAAAGITGSQLAANTITAGQILAGTITAAQIAANTITASQIAAGTITASQIAANTIAVAQLAAGIVYSGIVDATTVQAAEYIATSSQGEFLAYSGTPALGNLITAIAGAAGSDSLANPFPEGLFSQQLTLQNQASAPPAFSGGSVFYSSVAGRPRYLSAAGSDNILDRGSINVSQFTTAAYSPTYGIISAPLSYMANEGNQSSDFEIEIRGNGTGNSSPGSTLTMQLYVDGALFGGGWAIGATWFTQTGNGMPNFRYTANFALSILTTGSGGTAIATSWGTIVNSGNFQAGGTGGMGGITTSTAFDTTSNHTLQVYASWGSNQTGQTLTTYRTRITRHS